MESFYGGRQGASFVIAKRFDGIDIPENTEYTGDYYAAAADGTFFINESANPPCPIVREPGNQSNPNYIWTYHLHDGSEVVEGSAVFFKEEYAQGMVQFFKKGAETISEVGYGEYVIIDTIANMHNYNSMENGIVYRRGMDHQQDAADPIKAPGAGAEYIGQVIGPQGEAPIVNMDTVSNIKADKNFGNANSGEGISELVSGKTNDTIKYAWVEMIDAIGNNIGVKLGFTFPYTEFDFVAERLDAYTDPFITRLTEDTEEFGEGDQSKPYYYKWKVSIPEGLHGIDSTNIEVYGEEGKKRLRYTQTDYTNSAEGQKSYIDIGEYKMISGVSLSSDGILTVAYTYGDSTPLDESIKWIGKSENTNGITIANDGTVTVIYNTGEQDIFEDALTWITNASLSDRGEFKILYNNNKIAPFNTTLRWINKCTIADDGTIQFYYCTGEPAETVYENYLKKINDVKVDTGDTEGEGSQKLIISYNTGEEEYIGNSINYIMETAITSSDSYEKYGVEPYHLLILYADPAKRGRATYFSTYFNTVRTDWLDLGYVKGETGALQIIGNFDDISHLKDGDGNWLPPSQVQGYNAERAGWGYTIGNVDFYLYDYNTKEWYCVGRFDIAANNVIVIGSETDESAGELFSGGTLFVVEESNSIE